MFYPPPHSNKRARVVVPVTTTYPAAAVCVAQEQVLSHKNLLECILGFLEIKDLARTIRCSRIFQQVTSCPRLWSNLDLVRLNATKIQLPVLLRRAGDQLARLSFRVNYAESKCLPLSDLADLKLTKLTQLDVLQCGSEDYIQWLMQLIRNKSSTSSTSSTVSTPPPLIPPLLSITWAIPCYIRPSDIDLKPWFLYDEVATTMIEAQFPPIAFNSTFVGHCVVKHAEVGLHSRGRPCREDLLTLVRRCQFPGCEVTGCYQGNRTCHGCGKCACPAHANSKEWIRDDTFCDWPTEDFECVLRVATSLCRACADKCHDCSQPVCRRCVDMGVRGIRIGGHVYCSKYASPCSNGCGKILCHGQLDLYVSSSDPCIHSPDSPRYFPSPDQPCERNCNSRFPPSDPPCLDCQAAPKHMKFHAICGDCNEPCSECGDSGIPCFQCEPERADAPKWKGETCDCPERPRLCGEAHCTEAHFMTHHYSTMYQKHME